LLKSRFARDGVQISDETSVSYAVPYVRKVVGWFRVLVESRGQTQEEGKILHCHEMTTMEMVMITASFGGSRDAVVDLSSCSV
jgi:hypothetical protein